MALRLLNTGTPRSPQHRLTLHAPPPHGFGRLAESPNTWIDRLVPICEVEKHGVFMHIGLGTSWSSNDHRNK
jgi:hypothetical protein